MMRKLLILMLVLVFSITSTSYGLYNDIRDDFVLSLSGTTLSVIGVAGASALSGAGIYGSAPPYDFTGTSTIETGAGNTAGALAAIGAVYNSGGWDGADFSYGDSPIPLDAVEAGTWFTFGYTGNVGDVIDVYDYALGTPLVGTITIIPEPMTIALLGLGGLFLRRRKVA